MTMIPSMDSYKTSYASNQNILANAEKYIPSNLFQTIYSVLPNIFVKESKVGSFPVQGSDFTSEYYYSADYVSNTTQQNLIQTAYTPSSEETASEVETPSEEQRKKKGKNKASVAAKKNWTQEEEDELILTLGLKYKNDWKRVAKQILKIRGRKLGPKKLKDHFKSLTKGSLPKRIKFTHEEDLQIAKFFEQFGADWAKIATFLPARSAMMVKNRFYSFIRKKNLVNNLLNELSNSDNQNLEAEESLNSPVVKEEEENEDHESEEQTPFISYKEGGDSDSVSKISYEDNLSEAEVLYKMEPTFGFRETYFSDFDDDCYLLFEQSFKQANF